MSAEPLTSAQSWAIEYTRANKLERQLRNLADARNMWRERANKAEGILEKLGRGFAERCAHCVDGYVVPPSLEEVAAFDLTENDFEDWDECKHPRCYKGWDMGVEIR